MLETVLQIAKEYLTNEKRNRVYDSRDTKYLSNRNVWTPASLSVFNEESHYIFWRPIPFSITTIITTFNQGGMLVVFRRDNKGNITSIHRPYDIQDPNEVELEQWLDEIEELDHSVASKPPMAQG